MSLDGLLAAEDAVILNAINKVGMWRVKAKSVPPFSLMSVIYYAILRHLRLTAEKLRDEFDSDVPQTIEGLISLPGVGPKIGFLTLQAAWNMCVRSRAGCVCRSHATAGMSGSAWTCTSCASPGFSGGTRRIRPKTRGTPHPSALSAGANTPQGKPRVVAPQGAAVRDQPSSRGIRPGTQCLSAGAIVNTFC